MHHSKTLYTNLIRDLFKKSPSLNCTLKLSTQALTEWSAINEYQREEILKLKGLPIIHHDRYGCNLPADHRFPMWKFKKVMEILISDGLVSWQKQVIKPERILSHVARLVHTPEYVEKFFNGKTTREEQRVTGFEWTTGLVDRVRYETGGTILTTELALQRGLASSTAGGTHHAFTDRGAGYCLINDMAVAAKYFLKLGRVEKVLILDLDVHQGDGTANIFQGCDSVFTFSMHCSKNFPVRKEKSDLDLELEPGAGDEEYMNVLIDYLPLILDSFRPDLVIYDAGVDPHKDDDLGKLKLTDKGIFERDTYVVSNVVKRGIPCSTVIGGGYSRNAEELARRHSIIHRAVSAVFKNNQL